MFTGNTQQKHFAFAGAGLTSAVIARELATKLDARCTLFETRDHIGGNCHTSRDTQTGVMVHRYGPHIFHTAYPEVWEYVHQFCVMMPFVNRVKAVVKGRVYTLPVNLHTINQYFNQAMHPKEAIAFIDSLRDKTISDPKNFEEQALASIGRELYMAFFYGYTKKQWGIDPTEIPASVLKRLPLRFDYNDNYYNHPYQAIPKEGYTAMIEKILEHPNIEVRLSTPLHPSEINQYDHTFWTGPVDAFYDYKWGRLSYRTVFFQEEVHEGDYQGNPVINYPDIDVPYTRIHEHKHFAPWETHEKSSIYIEYSKDTGPHEAPFYPMRTAKDVQILAKYQAEKHDKVTFVGRLGTYRYIDMDQSIYEALQCSKGYMESIS